MNHFLVKAITEKLRIRFVYNGKLRIGEPQCYGKGRKGTELIRVYLLQAGPPVEPLFNVANMEQLILLPENFANPGPNYKKGDSAMKTIFCEL